MLGVHSAAFLAERTSSSVWESSPPPPFLKTRRRVLLMASRTLFQSRAGMILACSRAHHLWLRAWPHSSSQTRACDSAPDKEGRCKPSTVRPLSELAQND